MPDITFYSKPNCPLCDQARSLIERVRAEMGNAAWTITEVNILEDADMYRQHRYRIPVIAIAGGVTLVAPLSLDLALLRRALQHPGDREVQARALVELAAAAEERERMAANPGPDNTLAPATVAPPAKVPAGPHSPPASYAAAPLPAPLRALNTLGNGFSRNLLAILTGMLGVWVTLPWLAPVFARLGWSGPADVIYTAYMFFCHQLPERAANLFGYQVAWCYRNTAIYTSLFLTGLLYVWLGQSGRGPRVLRTGISWQVAALCALPLALDGFSHLLGLRTDNAWFDLLTGGAFPGFTVGDALGTLNWWLRVLTGGLFGVAAALFAYPLLARTLQAEATTQTAPPSWPPPVAAQPTI